MGVLLLIIATQLVCHPATEKRWNVPRVAVLPIEVSGLVEPSGSLTEAMVADVLRRGLADGLTTRKEVHVIRHADVMPVVQGWAQHGPVAASFDEIRTSLGVEEAIHSSLMCERSTRCQLSVARHGANDEVLAETVVELDLAGRDQALAPLTAIPAELYGLTEVAARPPSTSLADYLLVGRLELAYRVQGRGGIRTHWVSM